MKSLTSRFVVVAVSYAILGSGLTVFAAEEKKVSCPADALCPKFKVALNQCEAQKKGKACDEFVDLFKKLTPRFDCKRGFDTAPVPAVWLCDEGETTFPKSFERGVGALSKLKGTKARAFFGSEELRSTLDGAVAEEFYDASKRAGRKKK